jgi:hypothetical protein
VIIRQDQKIILLQEIKVRDVPEESEGYQSSQPESQQPGLSQPESQQDWTSSQLNQDGRLRSEKDLVKLWESEPSKKGTPKPTMSERWVIPHT